jgi:hypothetical protein
MLFLQVEALSNKIKVVTSKTIGIDPDRLAAPYIRKISNLWRGSLISEEEMEKIRRKRESKKTDEDRAKDLYWSMYHDRLAMTAATAFSEVTQEVKEANGGSIQAWEKERKGKLKARPVSAGEIQEQLESIVAALTLPEEGDYHGFQPPGSRLAPIPSEGPQGEEERQRGCEEEEGEEKSAELEELEALVAQQRDSRKAFHERLRAEQEALTALTQRAGEQESGTAAPIDGEELKKLIKAATFSGYRLAELKREREERTGEAELGKLHEQRAKFERFVAQQRQHLKEQTEKVNELLEHMQQRAVWDAQAAAHLGKALEGAHSPGATTSQPLAAGPLYRGGLWAACVPMASTRGRALLRGAGEASEAAAFAVLQTATDPSEGGPGREHDSSDPLGAQGAFVALAAALNALQLDRDRLWEGPWRWQSAHLLRMALPPGAAVPETAEGLAVLVNTTGAEARAWRAEDSSHERLHHLLSELFSALPDTPERAAEAGAERGVMVAALAWPLLPHAAGRGAAALIDTEAGGRAGGAHVGVQGDATAYAPLGKVRMWASICGWAEPEEMALVVPHSSPLRCEAFWCPLAHLRVALTSVVGRESSPPGLLVLRPSGSQTCLLSCLCLRGVLGDLPPIHDFVMLLESLGPKVFSLLCLIACALILPCLHAIPAPSCRWPCEMRRQGGKQRCTKPRLLRRA